LVHNGKRLFLLATTKVFGVSLFLCAKIVIILALNRDEHLMNIFFADLLKRELLPLRHLLLFLAYSFHQSIWLDTSIHFAE
jgi:hypothetical protein